MKDICWGYVRSHIFLKGQARKSVVVCTAFTSNFFLSDIFPTAYNFFIYFDRGGPAGGASLFAGLHDFCGLVESRTITSPPLERCGVSYRIFSRRGCQVVSWLILGHVFGGICRNQKIEQVDGSFIAWHGGFNTPGHSNLIPFSADVLILQFFSFCMHVLGLTPGNLHLLDRWLTR